MTYASNISGGIDTFTANGSTTPRVVPDFLSAIQAAALRRVLETLPFPTSESISALWSSVLGKSMDPDLMNFWIAAYDGMRDEIFHQMHTFVLASRLYEKRLLRARLPVAIEGKKRLITEKIFLSHW